eukprot:gnl/Spiro4/11071_TR5866_c0_g2_i1.p1 gnl/Spiro4/11071_TR5866_c0_g2~~gnl/Spiro4/11071_TR5866_c0_g2_i1.p1  ORF type:complete len:120 (-),score=36.39 gnl/Spiro4/11071_TR5866_c0_g2_i1:71-430(-)
MSGYGSAQSFSAAPVTKFGTQASTPRKIHVFKLGEMHDNGEMFMLQTFKNLNQLKVKIAEKLSLLPGLHPQRGIMTLDGRAINDLSELEDGGRYVVMRSGFSYSADKVPPKAREAGKKK